VPVGRPLVGDYLGRFPGLKFDIDDHLRSLAFAPALVERCREFQSWLSGSHPGPDTRARILAVLRDELAGSVPGYGGQEMAGRGPLEQLPFIHKSDLREDQLRYVSSRFQREELWCLTTFGTSGTPISVLYDAAFYYHQLLCSVREVLIRAEIEDHDERPVLCVHLTDSLTGVPEIFMPPGTTAWAPVFRLPLDLTSPEKLKRWCDVLRELRPATLSSRPEVLEVLLAGAERSGQRLDGLVSSVLSSGSRLTPRVREATAAAFAAPVLEAYGLTEFGIVASRCPAGTMHLDDTRVVAEVVDDEGVPLLTGTGELVLSSVENRAMPLLRYRTGDLATLKRESCRCGRPGLALTGLLGREVPVFRFSDGSAFAPTHFSNFFLLFPLNQYQVIETGRDSVLILIEPGADAYPIERLVRDIEAYVRQALPSIASVQVRQHFFGDQPRFQRYVSAPCPVTGSGDE